MMIVQGKRMMKKVQKRRVWLLAIASIVPMVALPLVACSVNSGLQDGSQIDTSSIKANLKAKSVLPSEVTNQNISEYIEIGNGFTFVKISGYNNTTGVVTAKFSYNDATVEVEISGFKKLSELPPQGEGENNNQDNSEIESINFANELVRNALKLNDVINQHPISAMQVGINTVGQYIDFLSGMNELNRIKKVNDDVKFKLEDVKAQVISKTENPSLLITYRLMTANYTSDKFFKSVTGWSEQNDIVHKEFVNAINSISVAPKLSTKYIPSTKIKTEANLKEYFMGLPESNNIYTAKLVSIEYLAFSKIKFTYTFNSQKQSGLSLLKSWEQSLSQENFLKGMLPKEIINTNTLAAPRELDVENVNYKPTRFTILYTDRTKNLLQERFLIMANSWFESYKDQLTHLLSNRYELPKDGWEFSLRTDNTDWSQVNGPDAEKLWELHQTDGRLDRFETLIITLRRFKATITVKAWHTSISEEIAVEADTILTGSDDIYS